MGRQSRWTLNDCGNPGSGSHQAPRTLSFDSFLLQPRRKHCYQPHSADVVTETRGGTAACPRMSPGLSDSRAHSLHGGPFAAWCSRGVASPREPWSGTTQASEAGGRHPSFQMLAHGVVPLPLGHRGSFLGPGLARLQGPALSPLGLQSPRCTEVFEPSPPLPGSQARCWAAAGPEERPLSIGVSPGSFLSSLLFSVARRPSGRAGGM